MSGLEHDGRVHWYLKLVKLHLLGGKVMKPGTALLNSQLCGIQALLERLGTRLEIFHLRREVLENKAGVKTILP